MTKVNQSRKTKLTVSKNKNVNVELVGLATDSLDLVTDSGEPFWDRVILKAFI